MNVLNKIILLSTLAATTAKEATAIVPAKTDAEKTISVSPSQKIPDGNTMPYNDTIPKTNMRARFQSSPAPSVLSDKKDKEDNSILLLNVGTSMIPGDNPRFDFHGLFTPPGDNFASNHIFIEAGRRLSSGGYGFGYTVTGSGYYSYNDFSVTPPVTYGRIMLGQKFGLGENSFAFVAGKYEANVYGGGGDLYLNWADHNFGLHAEAQLGLSKRFGIKGLFSANLSTSPSQNFFRNLNDVFGGAVQAEINPSTIVQVGLTYSPLK